MLFPFGQGILYEKEGEAMAPNVQQTAAAAGLGLAAAGFLAVLDSRYRLEKTAYTLSFARLPAAFDGFRIVQLSDLHGSRFGRGNRKLARAVQEQRPDLIALTGDFAGARTELEATEALLRQLQGLAPIYYVSGNHEWIRGSIWPMRQLLRRYGAHSLENRFEILDKDGAQIVVAGVEDPQAWEKQISPESLAAGIRREHPDAFVLWLGHRNFWVKEHPALPVDLILSGHAHGGVVRLPGIGGLLNNDHRLGAEYEAGPYAGEHFQMLVSRGLGNSVPVPRLFNRPELVTIVLKSEQA